MKQTIMIMNVLVLSIFYYFFLSCDTTTALLNSIYSKSSRSIIRSDIRTLSTNNVNKRIDEDTVLSTEEERESFTTETATNIKSEINDDMYSIEPKVWKYKRHEIGYEIAKQLQLHSASNIDQNEEVQDVVLLLNGFGVGSFHQHRLIHQYMNICNKDDSDKKDVVMYGIDYLGQGRSWPIDCNDGNSRNEEGLIYSADTWADQIETFIKEIITPSHDKDRMKLHVVGNSVGGHLAVVLAASNPSLFKSIVLLNPTPIWGTNLPFWSGHLPPPSIPRLIGRVLFDGIRDANIIEQYLNAAYFRKDAFMSNSTLIQQIRACTEGAGGHAAFASILWSPPATVSIQDSITTTDFSTMVNHVKCDVLLVFGKNDPWCKPIYGAKIMSILTSSQEPLNNKLIELGNVGHCPNHEAPQAVASALYRWIYYNKRKSEKGDFILEEEVFHEPWGDITMREVHENVYSNMSEIDNFLTSFLIK